MSNMVSEYQKLFVLLLPVFELYSMNKVFFWKGWEDWILIFKEMPGKEFFIGFLDFCLGINNL